jgi:hypothetical protein
MVALPGVGSAQTTHTANSPKGDLLTSSPLVIGTTTLKPGSYKVQCITVDGQEFLVVTSDDKQEVARVPCKPEVLAQAVKDTDIRSVKGADGVQTVTSVRIRGEKIAHTIATS